METREFIEKKSFKHHNNQNPFDRSKESDKGGEKLKHNLTVDRRLAVIKAKIVDKHSVNTIWADFKISSSLVYSILKSYKENGISKLVAKTKEKSLFNN